MKTLNIEEKLAKHFNCNVDDIHEQKYDHYGLTVYDIDGQEYAVGNDQECDDACKEYVQNSLWAFNASFILEQCDLPYELEEAIKSFCAEKCESANDAISALVDKCSSLESFTESAIRADGRGHFLSSYDGHEIEIEDLFAYKI